MNLFEASILSSVPLGACIGAMACRSCGIVATAGGGVIGGISGFVAGWLYAFVIICLMAVVAALWNCVICRSLKFKWSLSKKEKKCLTQSGVLCIITGIIGGGIIGFFGNWFHGFLFILLSAIVTAVFAVADMHIRTKNGGQD